MRLTILRIRRETLPLIIIALHNSCCTNYGRYEPRDFFEKLYSQLRARIYTTATSARASFSRVHSKIHADLNYWAVGKVSDRKRLNNNAPISRALYTVITSSAPDIADLSLCVFASTLAEPQVSGTHPRWGRRDATHHASCLLPRRIRIETIIGKREVYA